MQIVGKDKSERLVQINKISVDLRPLGRVRAIIKSPIREKDFLVTLMPLEKELLKLEVAEKIKKEKKKTLNVGISAVPISKKLPFMNMTEIPDEFIEDLKKHKKPQQRYYIAKVVKWETTDLRPSCEVI